MKVELILDNPDTVAYSGRKDSIILFTAFDRQDNNKFVSDMTRAIKSLDSKGVKMSALNISKESRYSLREVELNLHEIETIMNTLGV